MKITLINRQIELSIARMDFPSVVTLKSRRYKCLSLYIFYFPRENLVVIALVLKQDVSHNIEHYGLDRMVLVEASGLKK